MLSTGMSKKPWIWSACRSIVSSRATPTDCSMLATTLALIARRRGALQRVDHDEQLHQVVVGRRAGRLQHEYVLAAHVLEQLDHHLAVGKLAHDRPAEREVEALRHVLRETRVRVAGEHHQPLERWVGGHGGVHRGPSINGWGGRIRTLVWRDQKPLP